MIEDLTINVLPGKTRGEIKRLLGEPDETQYFSNSDYDLIYLLGTEKGSLNSTSDWLFIWFDESEIFERYEIRSSD